MISATFTVKIFSNLVKITVAWIGKTKHPAIQSLSDEYLKRIKQYAEIDGISVKDVAALLKLSGREGKSPRRYLVLLDSRGKQLSSEELAQFIARIRTEIPRRYYLSLALPMALPKIPAVMPISPCLLEK